MSALVPHERIEQTILVIRGHNVMLDSDLAQLYGVTVGRLNEAVKRNEDRFPCDFMFQLTKPEFEYLKSQIAISSSKWGGRRHAPYAFTEQGVAKQARDPNEHCHYASVCSASRADRLEQGACPTPQ